MKCNFCNDDAAVVTVDSKQIDMPIAPGAVVPCHDPTTLEKYCPYHWSIFNSQRAMA